MPRFSRRRFLERLGFAASAPLLHGIAQGLVGEAIAAPGPRRRAVIVVVGEAVVLAGKDGILPSGLPYNWTAAEQPLSALRPHLAPLEPFRNRLALVDGLALHPGSSAMHGFGYGLLTGRPTSGTAERSGGPTGVSFDQHLASVLGRSSAIRSVLFGLAGRSLRDQAANTFAAGAGQPLSHIGRPSLLLSRLAGAAVAATGQDAALSAEMRAGLLDTLRGQARTLSQRLAGPERVKLDTYLHAIEEYDRKQRLLATTGASCGGWPSAPDGNAEVRLRSMFNMAALALKCGVTNVVGVALGNGPVTEHGDYDFLEGGSVLASYDPHSAESYPGQIRRIWSFVSELVAGLITSSGIADELVVAMCSGGTQPGKNAGMGNHHNALYNDAHYRVAVALYDGTGALRTGGRYVRYAQGEHSMNDLFCTLGHALGAPTDDFGAGGPNRVKGPIAGLVAR